MPYAAGTMVAGMQLRWRAVATLLPLWPYPFLPIPDALIFLPIPDALICLTIPDALIFLPIPDSPHRCSCCRASGCAITCLRKVTPAFKIVALCLHGARVRVRGRAKVRVMTRSSSRDVARARIRVRVRLLAVWHRACLGRPASSQGELAAGVRRSGGMGLMGLPIGNYFD